MKKIVISTLLLSAASPAVSGDLIYTPINPGFGGNPLNFTYLNSTADAQNQFAEGFQDLLNTDQSLAEQFKDQLSGAVISGAATELTEAIFQDGAPPSGRFMLDDVVVNYVLTDDRALVTIFDGTRTESLDIPRPDPSTDTILGVPTIPNVSIQ